MRSNRFFTAVAMAALAWGSVLRAGEANPSTASEDPQRDMMRRYLVALSDQAAAQWAADYEAMTAPEQITAYQKSSRQKLIDALGGFPERCPLNAQTTGTIRRNGYTVEKVIFESQPKLHVTALLFLPDPEKFKPPYPAMVEPCGHSTNGKARDSYQIMGALLALNGMAALVYDPIDQAERIQYRTERWGFIQDGTQWRELAGVYGHQMIGIPSILLGRNTARLMIWDTIRAIDYLETRPEIDAARIGCGGNSGGGILTAYVVALEDRVKAAAPSCYLNNLPVNIRTISPQDAEHHTFAAMTVGPHQTDFLLMRAPAPTLLCEGTKDYFEIGGAWETFRYAKRLYTRMGFAERVDIIENDAPHGYTQPIREATARWMARWLLNKDVPIVEPKIELLTDEEAQCTPEGQVLLLPGARSAYDLNEDYENELAKRRAVLWMKEDRTARLDAVRRVAGIRKLDQLPPPEVVRGETSQRTGYRVVKLELRPEEGIVLPATLYAPENNPGGRVVVYVHELGEAGDAAPGGPIEKLVLGGARVLAVELRGTGRSQRTLSRNFRERIGLDWQDVSAAYALGRSYVGMRAEDILVAARYAAKHLDGGPAETVDLAAVGHVGVPALHAAALEPALFGSVKLTRTLVSWSNAIHCQMTWGQYVNAVHGALREYDLPNLAGVLGAKLIVEDARDGLDRPVAP